MNNLKKYLPSKKFITTIIAISILVGVFFLVKGAIYLLKNRKSVDSKGNIIPMTVGTIIQKDSNNNGIADWEEYLWGLDPNKNGEGNKEFIMAKKATLEKNGSISDQDESKTITQNELLSKNLFAVIISLQQSGDLDKEAVDSISNIIGGEVKSEDIPDFYTMNMLNVKENSPKEIVSYVENFANLLDKYSGRDIGSEMTIFAQGIVNNDIQALYASSTIADAYREFADDLIKMPVPNSLAQRNLILANDYAKVGESVKGFVQLKSDPIVGMKSLLNYKKYTDAIEIDLDKISNILQ